MSDKVAAACGRLTMSLIHKAAEILRSGGLVAFPTETVYGLGADATHAAAVRKIFAVKGRPVTNPLIVHVADAEVARRYVRDWPAAAERLAGAFWPGPLTLVLPKQAAIVDEVTAGRDTVALRVPDHPLTLQLLQAFDGPLAGPSANRSTRLSPTTAQHVRDELGERIDLILDGGECHVGIESTVVDLCGDTPVILRPGGVSRQQLESLIGSVNVFEGHVSRDSPAASPGQHEIHYAPASPAFWFDAGDQENIETFLQKRDPDHIAVVSLSPVAGIAAERQIQLPGDPTAYARRLYAALREVDRMRCVAILIEMPPDEPDWTAVRDRLRRASRPLAQEI